jgi:hypothetical protein
LTHHLPAPPTVAGITGRGLTRFIIFVAEISTLKKLYGTREKKVNILLTVKLTLTSYSSSLKIIVVLYIQFLHLAMQDQLV